MAKVKKNIVMSGLSGSLGPDHYARVTKDGRTIISQKPDFGNRQFSEGQLNVQSRTSRQPRMQKWHARKIPFMPRKRQAQS